MLGPVTFGVLGETMSIDDRPQLFAHPFSSYCWKALIALWENGIDFTYRRLDEPAVTAEWEAHWPLKRMPLLVDRGAVIPEATIIIEHLGLHRPGKVALIPTDPVDALEVRKLDRLSDNYLMTPMQTIVFDRIQSEGARNPQGVKKARDLLDTAYAWWDGHMNGREWAASSFSLADCAAGPALFYADWVHPIPERHAALRAYRARLLSRPSIARAVNEARPFRAFFPGGAPDRD
jgi:glutathione S-transferase